MKHIFLILTFLSTLISNSVFSQVEKIQTPRSFQLTDFCLSDIKTVKISPPVFSKSSQKSDGRLAFAKIIPVDIDFFENSAIKLIPDGEIYSLMISSVSAFSLGFYFQDFELKDGVELYLYSSDRKDVIGAITSENNRSNKTLKTAQVVGDSVFIELFVPKQIEQPDFKISKIYYDFHNLFGYEQQTLQKAIKSSCYNEIDINCEVGQDFQDIKHAVLKYTFDEDDYQYLCTGALINNYKNDCTPYVLTAAHCICKNEQAQTLVAYFNYEIAECGNNVKPKTQSLEGATIVATSELKSVNSMFNSSKKYPALDFTLLKLDKVPPATYLPYYAGFTTNETSNLTFTTCIHHPNGDYKKISTSSTAVYQDSYPNDDDPDTNYDLMSHWHISRWDNGTTESGSSGSPLFNIKKQIIGDLSGGYASCTNPVNDFFQMFSKAWKASPNAENQLKYWLAGESGITELEHLDPYHLASNYVKSEIQGVINSDTSQVELSWEIIDPVYFTENFEKMTSNSDIITPFLANTDNDNTISNSAHIDYSGKGNCTSYILLNSNDEDYKAFSGNRCLASFTASENSTNDFLILNKFSVLPSSVLTFAAKSVGGKSTLRISQNANPQRFSTIQEIEIGEEWTVYTIPLSDFSGSTIYLNLNNITESGKSEALLLDDIKLQKNQEEYENAELAGYQVFCNNELVAELGSDVTSYFYNIQKDVSYTFFVRNVYADGGISGIYNSVTFYYKIPEKTPVNDVKPEVNFSNLLYPNPANDVIYFKPGSDISRAVATVRDVNGKILLQNDLGELKAGESYAIPVNNFKSGIYILTVNNGSYKISLKFVVN